MNPLTAYREPSYFGNSPYPIPDHSEEIEDPVDWNQVERHVRRLQRQLANAVEQSNSKLIRHYKELLRRSFHAKMLAIRHVTQLNQGRRTAGIDGKRYLTPSSRKQLLSFLDLKRKPQPVRRLYIPKKNGKLRPLGIPTIHDRVVQMVHKMAMEPQWEMQFEPNSYGFRPGRSTWDAIGQLFNSLAKKTGAQWMIEGDIKGFFDHVDHDKLLARISPEDRGYMKKILKAPVVDPQKGTQPSMEGTPQGGLISPLLANIALHGMEQDFRERAFLMKMGKCRKACGMTIVRYADDFIVTCKTKEQAEAFIPFISKWLKEQAGVELSLEKTRITHIEDGFDFLGFNVRKYKGKMLIKPAKKSRLTLMENVSQILSNNKTAKAEQVIRELNPLLRGWANYYRSVVSSGAFAWIDHQVWTKVMQWATRRHPNKGIKWVRRRYFKSEGLRNWVFTNGETTLVKMTDTKIVRHLKIQGKRSPYRPNDADYFSQRKKELQARKRKAARTM